MFNRNGNPIVKGENMFDRNGNPIVIKDIDYLNNKIKLLKEVVKDNPTKEIANKIKSLLASETFLSLFIEGEISSRRNIKKTFLGTKTGKLLQGKEKEIIEDFIAAYAYAAKPKEFNISNLFTLYSIVSRNGLEKDSKLADGKMFRDAPVYISSNQLARSFQGFKHIDIPKALKALFDFMNDDNYDLYLRAIIGHIYFEMIHPYFDFNGRTGRFLPMWLFANDGRLNEMMYFATAVGNYKDQYRSIFNKNIDLRTYKVNMDKMASKFLDLLILNQKQYIWIKNLENKYIDKTTKSFSDLQKSLLWTLMIKSEISNNASSWFKLTDQDKIFIESEIKPSYFSQEVKKLLDNNIVSSSTDKIKKYKLLNYKLLS